MTGPVSSRLNYCTLIITWSGDFGFFSVELVIIPLFFFWPNNSNYSVYLRARLTLCWPYGTGNDEEITYMIMMLPFVCLFVWFLSFLYCLSSQGVCCDFFVIDTVCQDGFINPGASQLLWFVSDREQMIVDQMDKTIYRASKWWPK